MKKIFGLAFRLSIALACGICLTWLMAIAAETSWADDHGQAGTCSATSCTIQLSSTEVILHRLNDEIRDSESELAAAKLARKEIQKRAFEGDCNVSCSPSNGACSAADFRIAGISILPPDGPIPMPVYPSTPGVGAVPMPVLPAPAPGEPGGPVPMPVLPAGPESRQCMRLYRANPTFTGFPGSCADAVLGCGEVRKDIALETNSRKIRALERDLQELRYERDDVAAQLAAERAHSGSRQPAQQSVSTRSGGSGRPGPQQPAGTIPQGPKAGTAR